MMARCMKVVLLTVRWYEKALRLERDGFLIQPLFSQQPRPMLLACDHDAAPCSLCTLKHMSGSATAVNLSHTDSYVDIYHVTTLVTI